MIYPAASSPTPTYSGTLLLVDGHYYAYRSFFAIRGLTNSRGEPTNAIFGFVKAIRRMLADLHPDCVAVVWDEGLPERRMALRPDYKQQRDETPGDLVPQLAAIRELLPLMGIASLGLPGHEADDLIASYAVAATQAGLNSVLATNDKDLYQLVSDSVAIYSTAKADARADGGFALLGPHEVTAKWGVAPPLILDILALTGDSVDNIPGVPGIGPKTAAKLIAEHGPIRKLLDHLDQVAHPALRDKLATHRQTILDNLEMVRLDLDLPLPKPISQLGSTPQWHPLIEAIDRLEFRTLARELRAEAEAAGHSPRPATTSQTPAQGTLVQGQLL